MTINIPDDTERAIYAAAFVSGFTMRLADGMPGEQAAPEAVSEARLYVEAHRLALAVLAKREPNAE